MDLLSSKPSNYKLNTVKVNCFYFRISNPIPTTAKMNTLSTRLVSTIRRFLYNPSLGRLPSRTLAQPPTGEGEGVTADLTVGEKRIIAQLNESFPDATYIDVMDISGGCGAMYQISIESPQFAGKRTVMQHRMVNQALAEEIKLMHGLQLKTKAPDGEK